jgi:hypothetical protein
LPALFFQTPGTFAPFFSPIGFSWCSHASLYVNMFPDPFDEG